MNLIDGLRWLRHLRRIARAKREYAEYLALLEPKLRYGALVVADNVGIFERDMKDYLGRVRSSRFYESRFVSVGWDGIEVSRWRDGA